MKSSSMKLLPSKTMQSPQNCQLRVICKQCQFLKCARNSLLESYMAKVYGKNYAQCSIYFCYLEVFPDMVLFFWSYMQQPESTSNITFNAGKRVFTIVPGGKGHWLSPLLRFSSSGHPWQCSVLLESLGVFTTPLTRVFITHLYTVCVFVVKVGIPKLHILDSRH